ncbi:SixA phosphatase family protein [Sphingomonas sp.]|uniref:SixA phosphatase family protein n=1 Tax=Sphingomonas sp. TaxID=28214 RepID=UPI002DD61E00|nr:phosphoglycerate mutase family protein [Sphingomonas sp.]
MRLALAALALVAVALPASAQTYVVRHLNTPAGERDPDLLPAGKAGAEALAKWFRGKRLTAIYVSDYRRTRQTAAPITAARKLEPIVYDPRDTPALVARLKATKGPVLVVGHSNTVPDIVEQLGGTRPGDLKHEDFGDIWVVKSGRSRHARFAR